MTAETVRHETGIQWTHQPGYIGAVWNPTTGCARVSPGCDHCYAFQLHDQRYLANRSSARAAGYTSPAVAREMGVKLPVKAPQYDLPFSTVQLLDERRLEEPLRARKPRCYFVDSMADLLHEDVPDEYLDRVFGVMAAAYWHRFLLLTKRPERMREYLTRPPRDDNERGMLFGGQPAAHFRIDKRATEYERFRALNPREDSEQFDPCAWPLPNVWLGVSVEDQERADERIPLLLDTPAMVRFLSCEPLIGPLSLNAMAKRANNACLNALAGIMWGPQQPSGLQFPEREGLPRIDWVICGGESGRHARPFDLAWARSLRDQCRAAGVPFFLKQLGTHPYEQMALLKLRHSHGGDPEEWPEDLRIREWPEV